MAELIHSCNLQYVMLLFCVLVGHRQFFRYCSKLVFVVQMCKKLTLSLLQCRFASISLLIKRFHIFKTQHSSVDEITGFGEALVEHKYKSFADCDRT